MKAMVHLLRLYDKHKYWLMIFAGLVAFLVSVMCLIQLPAYRTSFSLSEFLESVALCLPFMVITIYVDYRFVDYFNTPVWQSRRLWIRIIAEGLVTILLALTVLVIGNLPFRPFFDLPTESIIISVLINSFAVFLIEFYVNSRNSQELQKEYIKMQYRQLKSQINPHFLFNSLNVLVSLINKDSDRASEYVKKLSEVYRYVLTYDTKDLATLREELDFIRNYMEILILRFGKGLSFKIEVENDYLAYNIPPMTLQLLVENAVKHNIITPSCPLVIQIFTDNGVLCVSNNVNPRSHVESSNGIGLKNLDEKYRFLANKGIDVSVGESVYIVKLPVI